MAEAGPIASTMDSSYAPQEASWTGAATANRAGTASDDRPDASRADRCMETTAGPSAIASTIRLGVAAHGCPPAVFLRRIKAAR